MDHDHKAKNQGQQEQQKQYPGLTASKSSGKVGRHGAKIHEPYITVHRTITIPETLAAARMTLTRASSPPVFLTPDEGMLYHDLRFAG